MRTLADARAHVVALSHDVQFQLLQAEGLTPDSTVLEYGCGMLDLACLLLAWLTPGHYVGVEPNGWLAETVFAHDPGLSHLWMTRQATLLHYDDFAVPGEFDFIFAHSVLSHAADYQLTQFLDRASRSLAPDGTVLASLRLGPDSNADEWVYPGVTFFTAETVEARAALFGLRTFWRPEHRVTVTAKYPNEIHDWVVFAR